MNRDYDKAGTLASKHEGIVLEEKDPRTGALLRKYTRGKMIGKGGFAKCYQLFSHQDDYKSAVKVIEKASLTRAKAREKLNSEIKIHRSLKSSHVVGFTHFFQDEANVYIILELCSNQTLNELIKRRKRITEVEAKYYLHQIVSGVKDLHNQKVIHRDLKLGNLFLNDKLEIKIGDFGLAAKLNFDAERRKTMCGTPNYIAPQILQSKSAFMPDSNGHSFEVDIWSIGVIAYAFVVGRPPFETSDVKATYNKIKACNYSFPDNVPLSKTVRKFISKMLMRDPSRRATVDQILSDDFFTISPFPKSLPISLLACPPNSVFMKQYSEATQASKSLVEINNGIHTSRGISEKKEQRENMNTDRQRKSNEKDSLGRVLVRASSIDRIEKKQTVQRASSTAALMAPKRQISMSDSQNYRNHGQGPHVWVTYSEENPKFGVCYLLNSNATGMRFNDSTCLVSNSNFTRIKYYQKAASAGPGEVYDIVRTPEQLAKKMKIITYYQKELKNRKQHEQNTITNEQRISRERLRYRETSETAMNIFVVRCYKTSKVNIFWFNNQDCQVLFKDCTQLLLTKEVYVTYVNKLAERKYFMLSEINEQPEEVRKRMNYFQTIMQKIRETPNTLNRNPSDSNKENQQPQCMKRSSSTVKIQRSTSKGHLLMKGCASMSRLAPYKLTK